jgi:hypothetical protein
LFKTVCHGLSRYGGDMPSELALFDIADTEDFPPSHPSVVYDKPECCSTSRIAEKTEWEPTR